VRKESEEDRPPGSRYRERNSRVKSRDAVERRDLLLGRNSSDSRKIVGDISLGT